ncbi:MAG: subtilisin-like proprotein convertase family protein [Bacteriovoracaceae bacterium]|jgi:subtilisin-like proprotein convertase family protein
MISCVPTPGEKTNSGKQKAGATVTYVPNSTPFISGTPTVIARQDEYYSWSPTVLTTGLTFSAVNLPSWLSVNPSTGTLSGIARNSENINNLYIRATRDNKYTQLGPFSLQVYGDPLKEHAWHLRNDGQKNFSITGGTAGIDINIETSVLNGDLGNGVSIAVSDSGLDIDHPDLFANVLTPRSKDYTLAAPYYGDPGVADGGDHGTSVAGLIAATGWNGIGSRGVAAEAKVAGLNYLSEDVTQSTAIELDQASDDFDIYNYSYGADFMPMKLSTDSTYVDQLKYGVDSQRGAKGSLYIKSAGNSFQECDFSYSFTFAGLFCFSHNSNLGTGGEVPWILTVGATNALGIKSSYSSHGSNLWVSAPGGEYGTETPAMMTTDVAGCGEGYSRFGLPGVPFISGGDGNTNCDYTHQFNGTSSAAPVASGVVALMLSANPSLTWRDIKHILASTSSKIDALSSTTVVDSSFDFDNGPYATITNSSMNGHVYSQGWVTNGAGYSFHNYYGFGQVDADAAVSMAKLYSANAWGPLQQTDATLTSSTTAVGSIIPDNDKVGLSHSINIASSYTVEAVQIKLNITHPRPGDLGIELTSPSGTKSIIMNVNNSLLIGLDGATPDWIDDYTDSVFLSNAFYGENSNGNWTLKVIDGLGSNTGDTDLDSAPVQVGTLVNWSINVIGR